MPIMSQFVARLSLIRFIRDWRTLVRMHFLHAAVDSGLLEALRTPASRDELLQELKVKRPELLDALLDVGLALGELSRRNGCYKVKGRRARSLIGDRGDPLAALIQANVTYYNSVYRNVSDRLRGAPRGEYLEEIGDLVARVSKLAEPYVRRFVKSTVAGRQPMRILDVGCGSGVYLRAAHEANRSATGVGIDMDGAVVEQARRNLERWGMADRFEVMVSDIRELPADLSGPFDLITLYNVIYYIPVAERASLFSSLRSLLSPIGTVAIVTSTESGGRDLFAANLNLATSSMVGNTPLPELDEITAQLDDGGFTSIKITRLVPRSAFYGIHARGDVGSRRGSAAGQERRTASNGGDISQ
jgi:4-hydroxy-2,2'-bipyrrole-5-carbaldehyde O-methyltransferase